MFPSTLPFGARSDLPSVELLPERELRWRADTTLASTAQETLTSTSESSG